MPYILPLAPSEAGEKVEQTYGRLAELFAPEPIPEAFQIYGRVPAFLQDFYMNFKKFVYTDGKLDVKTKSLVALAVSATQKSRFWTEYFIDRCRKLGHDEQVVADVIAVASTNAMYNVFFKFRDIAGRGVFEGMSVGLRAHTFANTSLDESTVELLNIAISDINSCKPCTAGHVSKAQHLGIADEAVLEAVQCAATMIAGIQFLSAAGY